MILLKHAWLFDANYNMEQMDVLIDGEYILRVEPEITGEYEMIEMSGYTLMPGLFDAHVHLCPARVPDAWIFDKERYKQWARSGILGVRDMGLHMRSTEQFLQFSREISGPEYPEITTYGPFIYAPGDMEGPFPTNTTASSAAATAAAGVSYRLPGVKMMLNMKSNDETKAVLAAVADTAKAGGIKSAAHIYISSDIELLLDFGVTEAAHSPMDRLPEQTIARMKEADMAIVPTVANYYRMYRDGMLTEDQFRTTVENIGRCNAANIRIGFGTDFMLSEDRPYIGYMVPTEEMRLMARAGMSVRDVIKAATINSAYLCGLDSVMGTIEPGKYASLVGIAQHLDESFTALDNIPFVMNKGTLIKYIGKM